MQINSLRVGNFRAITQLELRNLARNVVIAGPNGCGKSCIFDAIRLLKSAYGGYQPDEWQSWFGEFQINLNQRPEELLSLFQNRSRPLTVAAEIGLAPEEVDYLRDHAESFLTDAEWRGLVPAQSYGLRNIGATSVARQLQEHRPMVEDRVKKIMPDFLLELRRPTHAAQLTIRSGGGIEIEPSTVLAVVFSVYDSQHLGVIDYHGPNRNYNREQIGGINLSIESTDQRLRQHALYNYANKYANLKSEMAGAYIRQLLARQSDPSLPFDDSLTETLKDLFSTFFPGKQFLGPQPTSTGRLLFPVLTSGGGQHDIDELSSGEKEVLYGYLRLRNAAPRNSVLLIDEPELHLNPRLVSGLASFYSRHLGRPLNSQLWLLTHSDTLIREAVGQQDFAVFHMQPPGGQVDGSNQVVPVEANADVERVVIELVGDLAAYRPGAKLVVFEGGGDSEFDVRMTCTLFPEFQTAVNPISGGGKRRVADLYSVLERARQDGQLPMKVYAITDSDGQSASSDATSRQLQWDVYHIENYLLESHFIRLVLRETNLLPTALDSDAAVLEALRDCAAETIPSLIAHRLRTSANKAMVQCIDLAFDPNAKNIPVAIGDAITRSCERIDAVVAGPLRVEAMRQQANQLFNEANAQLTDGRWLKTFRGRDVLKRFVERNGGELRYEPFRNLVIARMRDKEYRPAGMKRVVDEVLKDSWRSGSAA